MIEEMKKGNVSSDIQLKFERQLAETKSKFTV
jgi:hypothetical protein